MSSNISKHWSPVRFSRAGNPDLLHFVRTRPHAKPLEIVAEAAQEDISVKVERVHEIRLRLARERETLGRQLLDAVLAAHSSSSGCIVVDQIGPTACAGSAARDMLEWKFGRPLDVLEDPWQTCGCAGCVNPAHLQWSRRRDDGVPGKVRTKQLQWAHQSRTELAATLAAQLAELTAR